MKVIALVSGGKDSCYVMLKCLSYNHQIVALAHISPPADVEEMDSFMYQSIGTKAVPALAEALGLPLYTRETSANAHVTSLAYAPTAENDEVEDLLILLQDVKAAHPDVTAVCAGALWSDYQRLRVESAASRAGLLSLAYLWRRDQTELLDEMVAAGVHAVLVKVAAVGLNDGHLGKSLAEMRPVLKKLEAKYGVHVCGEGGEFESLVLSLPTFQKDLVLGSDVSVVCHMDDPVAPVYFLSIPKLTLKDKRRERGLPDNVSRLPPPPPIPEALQPLEDDFSPDAVEDVSPKSPEKPPSSIAGDDAVSVSSHRAGGYIHVVVRGESVAKAATALRAAIREERREPSALSEESDEPLADVLFVWLYLDSLSGKSYASANASYVSIFGTAACTPPPARACVGMRGTGSCVALEAVARVGRRQDPSTSTLHVQSISEWAPPCIGPYAQTVCDAGVAHICGVLPLHAPTVTIPPGLGARAQARGCMYNMGRTLEATPAGGHSRLALVAAYVTAQGAAEAVEEEAKAAVDGSGALVAIVPVESLPKGALVEIRAIGCIGGALPESWGGDSGFRGVSAGRLRYAVIEVKDVSGGGEKAAMEGIRQIEERPSGREELLSLQVYCNNGAGVDAASVRDILHSRRETLACSKLFADVDWLTHDAGLMCIATFVSPEAEPAPVE